VGSRAPRTIELADSCCAPLTAGALDEEQASELASTFKVLADPARLRLLSMVASAEAGEACACDLVEPVGRSQPTVSHHLSALVEAGLLTREKRGRWAWYRVAPERLTALRAALDLDASISG
jgi:ArsR family transcriptional regulator, arsenate/arsenite/antimonite-responsive transcriptional repressor